MLFRSLFTSFRSSLYCGVDGGGAGGGGGGDGEGDKTFSQEEVNAIIAKERKSWEAKSGEALKQAKDEAATKQKELQEQLDALKSEFEDSKLSAADKEKKAAERAQNAMKDQIAQLQASIKAEQEKTEAAAATLRGERIARHLSSGLTAANVFKGALSDAIDAFGKVAKVELDDNGQPTTVTMGESAFTDIKEAATAFLKDRPHFQTGTAGGAGTRPPNGSDFGGKPMHEASDDDLWNASRESS